VITRAYQRDPDPPARMTRQARPPKYTTVHACLANGNQHAFVPARCVLRHLPAPLRSTGITRLLRYYECSDSCPGGLPGCSSDRSHGLSPGPSVRSASNHLMTHPHGFLLRFPFSRAVVLGRACAVRAEAPGIRFEVRASSFASRLAASSGRIEFVILRTGRSSRVALHPNLRWASPLVDAVTFDYGLGNLSPTRTCTSLNNRESPSH
jgi:hypothetical protein